MKISKQLRDDAATICAIVASTGSHCVPTDAQEALFGDDDTDGRAFGAWRLAWDAIGAAGDGTLPQLAAEAEALLRTGWTP